jgi:2-polyprenyl-3-methyl-5-hydroxy-6-metoxy-1,4-benzoquinol methylase
VSPIVQCKRCGLLFANPFPIPEDPQDIYGDPDKYLAGQPEAEKVANQRKTIQDLKRRLGATEIRLLDIGSGRGELLAAAEREKVIAVGLEFSQAMIEAAASRGYSVLRQSAEDHAAEDHVYDAVVLASVIEHVHDPDSLVAAISKLLRPGGIAYVECPNEPNLLTTAWAAVSRLRRSRAVLNLSPSFTPFHVYGFNPQAISTLFAKHGCHVVEVRIWAYPRISSTKGVTDWCKAVVGSSILWVANRLGRASNMEVWAVKAA